MNYDDHDIVRRKVWNQVAGYSKHPKKKREKKQSMEPVWVARHLHNIRPWEPNERDKEDCTLTSSDPNPPGVDDAQPIFLLSLYEGKTTAVKYINIKSLYIYSHASFHPVHLMADEADCDQITKPFVSKTNKKPATLFFSPIYFFALAYC